MDDDFDIYNKLKKDAFFLKLLEQIPDDEKPIVEKSLKDLCKQFTEGLLKPLNNIKPE